jgi:hypothetical protein
MKMDRQLKRDERRIGFLRTDVFLCSPDTLDNHLKNNNYFGKARAEMVPGRSPAQFAGKTRDK